MRIGCGLRVHRIDGNEYLYFWHYERENGRSRRREDYVGPARDPASRQNGGRELPADFSPVQSDVSSRSAPLQRSPQGGRAVPFCEPSFLLTQVGFKGSLRPSGG